MQLINLTLTLLMFLVGAWLYPSLPTTIPTHWNVFGQPDSFMPKNIGTWLLPMLTLLMLVLFKYTPKLDPKHEKYTLFAKEWGIIQTALISFFVYIYGVSLYLTLNPAISILPFMFAGLGSLFVIMGNYLSKIRQNFFIGIKVPWTLASVDNWNKTHRFASWTFVLAGIVTLLEAKFLWYAPGIVFGVIMLAAFLPILYSFLLFKKQEGKMKLVYLALALLILLVAGARLSTPEDSWICSNGQWIMHGRPSAPAPLTPCP